MTTPVGAIAAELATALLDADPFEGSELSRREYDPLVPDPSAAAEHRLAETLVGIAERAGARTPETAADAVTLAVVSSTCDRVRAQLAAAAPEHTVTAIPFAGPPMLFAIAARTVLADERAAEDYLARLHAAPEWVDGTTERLREGAAKGRYPVGSLLDGAVAWLDAVLEPGVPEALHAPRPPDGTEGWDDRLDEIARDGLVPALHRWRTRLIDLRPHARPDDRAGLSALPGGEQDYAAAVRTHTTLELTADELHRVGVDQVALLGEQIAELGSRLGLADRAATRDAARASAAELDPGTALLRAQEAVRRGEQAAPRMMPPPFPSACAVTPMPPTVADVGTPPHYTLPRADGSRPGTYWFNTRRPTAGTGWDLESVTFHETVPGHHLQLGRALATEGLPLIQQMGVTVHAEGWGLYAERLAGEFGLYSDVRAEIGALFCEIHRAARLVVDTGLHAFGWSRQRARDYLVEHVAMPVPMLHSEVDRYIAWPGQALAYLTGQREILRLRSSAQDTLGSAFDLGGFNAAVIDSGSVPMPVLAQIVDGWVSSVR